MEKMFIVGDVYCSEYPYNQNGYPVGVFENKEDAEKLVEQLHAYLNQKNVSYEYYTITEVLLHPEFHEVKPKFVEEK